MSRIFSDVRQFLLEHREKWPYIVAFFVCLSVYALSKGEERRTYVYRSEGKVDFKGGKILGSLGDSISDGKERLLSRSFREIQTAETALRDKNSQLELRIAELEHHHAIPDIGNAPASTPSSVPSSGPSPVSASDTASMNDSPIRTSQAAPGIEPEGTSRGESGFSHFGHGFGRPPRSSPGGGASILSFPVKEASVEKVLGVAIPSGSYVKAKVMTGIEAPEGKTYPVLLQLDYAYIVPNHRRIDLSGCFMIAKSEGDLSTERVQMQATKLSCVSHEGRMFERDVNGFIADDRDNSFAVIGSVNSKQDRVAAMAFLSSIVEGVGKAIEQAQTTSQVNPLGGSQSVLTGNQSEYLAAGGAANAASMVTQWYLKQAQNLLPTINVGSGRDVWVIMQDTVRLPNDYFKPTHSGGHDEGLFSYFSRVAG